ncbi:MAG: hypothetical protein PHQ20_04880 [Candidatus Moranbacteria bacterium]|nr:hypothetical protein [Candidatus Moranbacteria bacterium]
MVPTVADMERSARYHLLASVFSVIVFPILLIGSVVIFSLSWISPTVFWCARLAMAVLATGIAFAYFKAGNKSKVPRWSVVSLVIVATLVIK